MKPKLAIVLVLMLIAIAMVKTFLVMFLTLLGAIVFLIASEYVKNVCLKWWCVWTVWKIEIVQKDPQSKENLTRLRRTLQEADFNEHDDVDLADLNDE